MSTKAKKVSKGTSSDSSNNPKPKTNQLLYLGLLAVGLVVAAVVHAQKLEGAKKSQNDYSLWTKCYAAVSFVWLGMVLAISFMEAWVKFKAATLVREVGLDVGRTVFAAFNRVEIMWSIVSMLLMQQLFYCYVDLQMPLVPTNPLIIASVTPFILIALQSLYLQPYLDNRARQIIRKEATPKSLVHLIYVLFEVLKVVALAYTGLRIFA